MTLPLGVRLPALCVPGHFVWGSRGCLSRIGTVLLKITSVAPIIHTPRRGRRAGATSSSAGSQRQLP